MNSFWFHFWATLAFTVGAWVWVAYELFTGRFRPHREGMKHRSEDPAGFLIYVSIHAAFAVFCTALFLYRAFNGNHPAQSFQQ